MSTPLQKDPTTKQAAYKLAKQLLDQSYELRETIGEGAFSEVKKAIHRETGKSYAIKIIDRQKCVGKEYLIESEINILKKVRHENIIPLNELFETEMKIYLVMELVTGGELFDSIIARGHYTEKDAAEIVHKVLLAVDYLHDMGIAHRDLKPENLLFYTKEPNSKIMISDFGLSKIFNEEEVMKTACGTPGYVAPEVLKRQGYGCEVDIWSLGVITYILLCGYPPFYDENNQELYKQIMNGHYQFDSPHWDPISREAKDFIAKMLVVDPRHRITTKQALQHRFITSNVQQPIVTPKPVGASVVVVEASTEVATAVFAQTVQPANLAERVSTNLRLRGTSVSTSTRRRSIDQPHRAPPNPPAAEPTVRTLVPKNELGEMPEEEKEVMDSGVVADHSVSASTECQLHEASTTNTETPFLEKLGQVNALIDQGQMIDAYLSLQAIADCPTQVRHMYEEMIFNKSNPPATSAWPKLASDLDNVMESLQVMCKDSSEEQPKQASATKTIRMLSLNLSIRPPGSRSNNQSEHKDARLRYFCDHVLPNYDVICLQDFFTIGSRRREKLLQKAYENGMYYWVGSEYKTLERSGPVALTGGAFHPAALIPPFVDGGLVVLSRYDIVQHDRITFVQGVGNDRFVNRGALYAKIAVEPKEHVHIFNCSLQSMSEDETLSHEVRLQQLDELKGFIDSKLSHESRIRHDGLALLAGTFNIKAESESDYERMKSLLECGEPAKNGLHLALSNLAQASATNSQTPKTWGPVQVDGKSQECPLMPKKHQGTTQTVDYLFAVHNATASYRNSSKRCNYDVEPSKTKVEFFSKAIDSGSQVQRYFVVPPPPTSAPPAHIANQAAAVSMDSLSSGAEPLGSTESLAPVEKTSIRAYLERKKKAVAQILNKAVQQTQKAVQQRRSEFTFVSDHAGISAVITSE